MKRSAALLITSEINSVATERKKKEENNNIKTR